MAEYDLEGWTASDLINPDDVNVVMKKSRFKNVGIAVPKSQEESLCCL